MAQIRHKGTVFAGSPYDPLKHYVEEETYEADKAYTEADIAKILGDIAEEEKETALKAHTVGELILFEKKLYKVSTAIAIGDSIVAGTNVTETDIAKEFALEKAEDKSIRDALTYKSGDTITIPRSRYIAFGNSGGTDFVVALYMPKMFTTQRQFTINDSPYNYSGEIRVGGVNKASSTIYFTQFANTNFVNLNVNVQTGTGGSMEHAVWVPSGQITITLP